MSKSVISFAVTSTPLATVDLSINGGRRLVAVGKWGPAFEQPKPACGNCADFQQVMVRRGGRLEAVTCQCVSTGTGDDLPARIPTGSPKPHAVLAVGA
ncbi:hypothetical protein [Streptomyces sp. NRRL S-1022]|uniref:hypothetical protein n=1 Tax=Streptomyces sp. NRRL S-1022 TaxID=1463880 RepID=UPI0004C13F22|nr:hypothetical protein [Streptomyces sp. NRRL S-1022]